MLVPNRHASATDYRYGFNGKEKDDEVKNGKGNHFDYGMRNYDSRIGRFFSVDPLAPHYPSLTPYQFASNTPIQAIDLDGLERLDVVSYDPSKRLAAIKIVKRVFVNSNNIPRDLANLDNTKFAAIFNTGNASVYVSDMPQNGQSLKFIEKSEFDAGKGFQLDVTYDVSIQNTQNPNTVDLTKDLNSLVQTGISTDFTDKLSFARGTTDGTNNVFVNPSYLGFNPPEEWDSSVVPTFEELIAHEVGFHNMQRKRHMPDKNGKAIYPTGRTLESNLPGKIRPITTNTQDVLKTAVFNNNLNDPNKLLKNPTPEQTTPTPAQTAPVGG